MHRSSALAACTLLLAAAAASAGGLQVYEGTLGAPGVTATLPPGPSTADLDLDADTGEGGGLAVGATEIEIRPTGSVALVGFSCALPDCAPDVDYAFVPGDAASGGVLIVSDARFTAQHGLHDLGHLDVDGLGGGTVQLVDCNYTGADDIERRCDSFAIAALPEPGRAPAIAAGAALLLALGRRRHAHDAS